MIVAGASQLILRGDDFDVGGHTCLKAALRLGYLVTPPDLVDIAVLNGLHYDGTAHEGVVFHLIGALSEFGKLGVVCVGGSVERAEALYRQTVEILDRAQHGG